MKTASEKNGFLTILIFLVLVLMLGTSLHALAAENPEDPAPEEADASLEPDITPWHTVTLSPGETYDVGTAKKNTTVTIEEAGNYYLKGQSTYCRVIVRSSGVNLYLKDGLKIDPGIYSYVGSSTAAITVNDMGGTVRIISEKNAQIYLGGYYYAPAIRKDGHETKLIFETEDPSQPGTIQAYRSAASHSAGIGSTYFLIARDGYSGNMEFKSGKIIATGGTNAAGIGGGSGDKRVVNLVFSGADVTATGYGYGAGIGGGLSGAVDRLTISAGKIVATGAYGAGIGGGEPNNSYDGYSGTITITGGDITATSFNGSGIGTGCGGFIDHITITGGTIHATAKLGNGIGGTTEGTTCTGTCHQLDISGGTIYASGYAVGIGSSGSGKTVINISGGYIEAETSNSIRSQAIGGGTSVLLEETHLSVNISGGTILAKTIKSNTCDMDCTITGGSIRCSEIGCTPTDGKNNRVYYTPIDLSACPQHTRVTQAEVSNLEAGYGWNDVITVDGDSQLSVVYPWFPLKAETTEITAGDVHYYGLVKTSVGTDTLYPATKIVLHANTTEAGASDGSAEGPYLCTAAQHVTNAICPGYHVSGYTVRPSAGGEYFVLYGDGNFSHDPADPSGLTDDGNVWRKKAGTVDLYAWWTPGTFTVTFDGNAPANASTTLEGSMANQAFTYAETQSLTTNGFTLQGYTFSGWNTKADGTGTAVSDQGDGSRLCTSDQGTVTLYAQWVPITYSVRYDGNGATGGTMKRQTFVFDQSQALFQNAFTKDGQVFGGWNRFPSSFGSHYSDRQTVENLSYIQDGEVTLQAIWLTPADLMIGVSLDLQPQSGCAISLKNGGTVFVPTFQIFSAGMYTYTGTELPTGTYEVIINESPTGKTVTAPMTQTARFSYFSVNTAQDSRIGSVSVQPSGESEKPVEFGKTEGWLQESRFTIEARDFSAGYVFDSWQSDGVDPEYEKGSGKTSNPAAISIKGKTTMRAVSRPVVYSVRFEPNTPEGASTAIQGQMEDQLFTYDEAQELVPCLYTLEGYIFSGWNTRPDGKGTTYAECASVSNLSDADHSAVPLYAMWTPIRYKVRFDANLGSGEMADQWFTFDEPQNLNMNRFTRENWHFTGWNGRIGGTSVDFADGGIILNLTSESEKTITLYAQWSHDTYIVEYHSNLRTGASYEYPVWVGETISVEECGFSYKGYRFLSWNTQPDGTGQTYQPGDSFVDLAKPGQRVVFYAQWKKAPKTGDEFLLRLWGSLTVASAAGCILLKRRRKTDD